MPSSTRLASYLGALAIAGALAFASRRQRRKASGSRYPTDPDRLKIGILASGNGSNFQSIVDACRRGDLVAEPRVLIGNNSKAYVTQRAVTAKVPFVHISSVKYPDSEDLDQAMFDTLKAYDVDVVVLAGYMKAIGPKTVRGFRGRIINVHPALLPKYGGKGMYGMNVHKAVIAAGESESGATIHVVDDHYDTGPVLRQSRVSVDADDTPERLASKVHVAEHALMLEVLQGIQTGKIKL